MALLRELFSGGSTPEGFVNRFGDIADGSRYLYLIKGGPGVGKSSMMRKIGQRMMEEGYDVEYFLCSSDPRSLDGLYIRGLDIAMMDATSPHERDPKAPGIRDEIVHLGEHWNQPQLRRNREEAEGLFAEMAGCFRRASAMLAAIRPIQGEIALLYQGATDGQRKRKLTDGLMEEALSLAEGKTGRTRRFFASAIGSKGWYNSLVSLEQRSRRFILDAPYPSYWSDALDGLVERLARNGSEAIACHDPLCPDRVAHIDLPGADAAILTSCPLHPIVPREGDTRLTAAETLLAQDMARHMPAIEAAEDLRGTLLAQAIAALQQAMLLHDDLEALYIQAMDFDRNDRLTGQLIARMLGV